MKKRVCVLLAAALGGLALSTPAAAQCYLMCPLGDNVVTNPAGVGTRTVDFDGNGVVALADFAEFGVAFADFRDGVGFDPCKDFDCNGTIDLVDFARFGAHFGHAGAGFTFCSG